MSVTGAFIVPHPPIIIPQIGKGEEKKAGNTIAAYDQVAREIAELNPETIVVISPHAVMYADYIHLSPGNTAHGDFTQFGVHGVSLRATYDSVFVSELAETAVGANIPAGTLGERDPELDHGTLVPLHFISRYDGDYHLVRVSVSGLSPLQHYRFGKCIAKTAENLNRRIVIVASGDLSHRLLEDGPYGLSPDGPEFDNQVTKAMATADFLRFLTFDEGFCESAGECGLRSFIVMAGALDGKSVEPEFLSYEGPFGVGYAVCGYRITGNDPSRRFDIVYEAYRTAAITDRKNKEDGHVRLARIALETYVLTGKRLRLGSPETIALLNEIDDPELTKQRAGAFVSLKKDGHLRGCIGTITPTASSLAEEIVHNAVSAGTEDPRFDTVTAEELPFLDYSVDVLGNAEPISSLSQLDVKRYGVIVTKGHRRGLLLPDLKGVNTPEEQVHIALGKASIGENEDYQMERFGVVRHT